jgi:hypothetical protein
VKKAVGRFLPDTPLAKSAAAALVGDKGERLSVQKCRNLLGGDNCQMQDEEVEFLRDQCYRLAEILLSEYSDVRKRETQPQVA